MNKIIKLLLLFMLIFLPDLSHGMTITGGVSMTDRVPDGFFGNWKVMAVRSETSNFDLFAPYSVEIWNLTKQNDVITLTNPVSGASASITVKDATTDTFTFQRTTRDKNETVIETAKLILQGENFIGCDTMEVRYYRDGNLVKTEKVAYKLKAYKISGNSVSDIFGVK